MCLNVCAAIIIDNGLFLATQRGKGKQHAMKWEFPGGKVESGETEEDCIKREILEELGVEIVLNKKLKTVYHTYPSFKIKLIPFVCSVASGNIVCKEHNEFKWLNIDKLNLLDWAEADKRIVENLLALYG